MPNNGSSPKGSGEAGASTGATARITAFFQGHGRLFTVCGALVVFLTFVVKEELGESLKSLTDSIEAAENVFAVQADINSLHQTQIVSQHVIREQLAQNDLHTLTAEAMSDEHERDSGDIQQDRLAAEKERWRQNLESAQAYDDGAELMLGRAASFIEKLPNDDQSTRQLADEVRQRQKEREAHRRAIDPIVKAVESYRLARTPQGKPLYTTNGSVMSFQTTSEIMPEIIEVTSQQLAVQGKALSNAVDATIRRVFDRADKIAKMRSDAYGTAKVWAVVLYMAGWTLGLLGKLYDVKGMSSGE